MSTITVTTEPEARAHLSPALIQKLRRRTARLLDLLGVKDVELSLLLAGDDTVAGLNATWRKKRGPTDVLSFPQAEPEEAQGFLKPRKGQGPDRALGDLVIDVPYVKRRSPAAEAFAHDLTDLIAHGLLHLLGEDHPTAIARRDMLRRQAELVAAVERR
jgi:rRNA maturation RNase YbeY